MEDRIEINGVWYVKEDTLKSEATSEPTIEMVYTQNAVDAKGIFEAFILLNEENEIMVNTIAIEYKGKFITDNPKWLLDIILYVEDYVNWPGLNDSNIDKEDRLLFGLFIKALYRKGWID